jgi:hypothetical protein
MRFQTYFPLYLAVSLFIPGLLMLIFGCSDTLLCPLYTKMDTIVEGFHIDKNSCRVRRVDIEIPCYSLYATYSFNNGSQKCEHYMSLFTYQASDNNYGYAVKQTRKMWVSKIDGTCGLSSIARDIPMGGVIFMLFSAFFASLHQ